MPKQKFHEMHRVDRAIDNFASIENPTEADLNRVGTVAQVESILDIYRAEGINMSDRELLEEKHVSLRLGKHMTVDGDPRPHELCDAHAIISGAHRDAARLRAVLAWFQRRIDDSINGCWLPKNTKALSFMPDWLRKAVPHSQIHRRKYYSWLQRLINLDTIDTDQKLVETLRFVEHRLQSGTLPSYIMQKA